MMFHGDWCYFSGENVTAVAHDGHVLCAFFVLNLCSVYLIHDYVYDYLNDTMTASFERLYISPSHSPKI